MQLAGGKCLARCITRSLSRQTARVVCKQALPSYIDSARSEISARFCRLIKHSTGRSVHIQYIYTYKLSAKLNFVRVSILSGVAVGRCNAKLEFFKADKIKNAQ